MKCSSIYFRISVWSNGILLEYIEGDKKSETAFFPINTLHYCAAVRYVNVSGYSIEGSAQLDSINDSYLKF